MSKFNTIRIIAGKYKGYKLPVLDKKGLRPTTDRAKETIFNHLGNLEQASVLDLFAGSGALGYEALSRGAKSLIQVEYDRDIFNNLKTINNNFKENIKLYHKDAIEFLKNCQERFDLVFLDPPYTSNLLETSLKLILERDLIGEKSLVYIEHSVSDSVNLIGYECVKKGSFGQINFNILKKSSFIF